MRQIYRLILKEGWKVKHLDYIGDNEYHVELTKNEGDCFVATLSPWLDIGEE